MKETRKKVGAEETKYLCISISNQRRNKLTSSRTGKAIRDAAAVAAKGYILKRAAMLMMIMRPASKQNPKKRILRRLYTHIYIYICRCYSASFTMCVLLDLFFFFLQVSQRDKYVRPNKQSRR